MPAALIIYATDEDINTYVTEDPDLIAAAKKHCNKFANSTDTTPEEDQEIVALINALVEDDCSVELPLEDDVIRSVYVVGFIG